jgi:hypothetical protein
MKQFLVGQQYDETMNEMLESMEQNTAPVMSAFFSNKAPSDEEITAAKLKFQGMTL